MTFDGTAEFNGPGLLSIEDSGPAITNNGTLTVAPGAVVRGTVCCVNPDVFLNTGTVSLAAPARATWPTWRSTTRAPSWSGRAACWT